MAGSIYIPLMWPVGLPAGEQDHQVWREDSYGVRQLFQSGVCGSGYGVSRGVPSGSGEPARTRHSAGVCMAQEAQVGQK